MVTRVTHRGLFLGFGPTIPAVTSCLQFRFFSVNLFKLIIKYCRRQVSRGICWLSKLDWSQLLVFQSKQYQIYNFKLLNTNKNFNDPLKLNKITSKSVLPHSWHCSPEMEIADHPGGHDWLHLWPVCTGCNTAWPTACVLGDHAETLTLWWGD